LTDFRDTPKFCQSTSAIPVNLGCISTTTTTAATTTAASCCFLALRIIVVSSQTKCRHLNFNVVVMSYTT
jgi:hypothetical protein